MKDTSIYGLDELGMWVYLLVKGGEPEAAQTYLDAIQDRVNALKAESEPKTLLEVSQGMKPKTLLEVSQGMKSESVRESEEPPRDEQGNITRISTQLGDSGYYPDVHENKELKIFCDGVHIPTAHTADTVAGVVYHYEKNDQGRIKTLTKHGKVEIRGL